MTEPEWLACTDPTPMLAFLRGRASERKLRLFAVACCRHIRVLKDDAASLEAVEVAERFADGLASESVRRAARESTRVFDIYRGGCVSNVEILGFHTRSAASFACDEIVRLHDATDHARQAISWSGGPVIEIHARLESEMVAQCRLIRDIFGNPFRPVIVVPSWLDDTIPRIATAIYDERAFERMPELADLLADAGCTDADILGHCCTRSGHVRGCWVLDALLGRS